MPCSTENPECAQSLDRMNLGVVSSLATDADGVTKHGPDDSLRYILTRGCHADTA